MLKIYTDGGSRGNPGKSACAFVVVKNNKIIKQSSKFLGRKTNNQAEYNAIILALSSIKQKSLEIISDSELVIKQLNQEYKIKKLHLQKLYDKIQKLLKNKKIKFSHLKRENKFISQADFLVNKKLDKIKPS